MIRITIMVANKSSRQFVMCQFTRQPPPTPPPSISNLLINPPSLPTQWQTMIKVRRSAAFRSNVLHVPNYITNNTEKIDLRPGNITSVSWISFRPRAPGGLACIFLVFGSRLIFRSGKIPKIPFLGLSLLPNPRKCLLRRLRAPH